MVACAWEVDVKVQLQFGPNESVGPLRHQPDSVIGRYVGDRESPLVVGGDGLGPCSGWSSDRRKDDGSVRANLGSPDQERPYPDTCGRLSFHVEQSPADRLLRRKHQRHIQLAGFKIQRLPGQSRTWGTREYFGTRVRPQSSSGQTDLVDSQTVGYCFRQDFCRRQR